MKRIPLGYTDYEMLVCDNCYYIDKTMYLEKLENTSGPLIYLRPRRFGKTLLTSMMYYYYDINSRSKFDTLFKDTYVYKNPTDKKNSYYVLKFDFSGMDSLNSIEKLEEAFNDKVRLGIKNFLRYYNFSIDIDYDKSASYMLGSLVVGIGNDYPIYVIIDEYDNFTNSLLGGNAYLFKDILGKGGFVRNFYSALKEYSGMFIKKIFMTGVCSISLDSMTLGFNIGTNITNKKLFNSMTGLTHDELKIFIDNLNINDDRVFEIMEENYDGYVFSKDSKDRVFNPTLTMYFLSEYIINGCIPSSLLDINIYSDFGKIKNIITLFNNNYYKDIINDIFTKGIVSGSLKEGFTLIDGIDRDDIVSLLYYFGYLTIDEINYLDYNKIIFKIPNKVINEVFNNCFEIILKEENIIIEDSLVDSAVMEMINSGSINKFMSYASKLLKESGNRTFITFNERYIQFMCYILIRNKRAFKTFIEYPLNGGYVDMMLIGNREYCKYDIMIEFKYIKKSEYNDNLLESKKLEGINQLKMYSEDSRIDKDKLKRYIVIFVGSDLKVTEVV